MRQRDRNTWLVTIAALAVAVFAIGGAHRFSVVALGLLSAAALALQITSQRQLGRPSPLLVLLAAAAGLTLVQLVPLPAMVMELLYPAAHDLIADGSVLAGSGEPVLLPLSLDPPGTLFELVKLCSYLALAYVAVRMAVSERGRIRILTAVGLVIGAAAAIGLLNKLLEARTLYGVYQPRYAYAEFLGPLLNRNHFASLLAAGTLVSAGLALRERVPMAHRLAWAAVAVLCLVESLLIQSRGAAIGLALGLGVFGGLLLLQRWLRVESSRRNRRPELAKVTFPAAILVLCGLTLVIFFSAGGVSEQLTATRASEVTEPHSKFMAWKSAGLLIEESPWIGVGRGAFESAFTRVHPSSGFLTFSHLENEYLQGAVDWGLPGALLLALVVAWIALVLVRRWNGGALAAAGIGVLVTVAAHSVVDFGLELPGLAVPILLVAATLTHVPVVEAPQRLARARLLRGGAVAGLVVVTALCASPLGRTLHEDHNLLREEESPSLETARAAMDRHPVDYLAAAHVAARLFETGNVEGRNLLNHALLLHPTHPELHRMAANMLVRSGHRRQALVEYHLAIAATRNPVELVRELVRRFPSPADAVRGLPVHHLHQRRIARILVEEGRPDVALPYLELVVAAYPDDALTFRQLADVAVMQKDGDAQELAARRLAQLDTSQENLVALARLLHGREKLADAEQAARRALQKRGHISAVLEGNLLLADIYIGAKNWAQARKHLTEMREQSEVYLLARREIHRRLAVVEDALGNPAQAEWERQRARGP
jgi:O-antigen ligase/tetratricopeptide (TPR) repeat protein